MSVTFSIKYEPGRTIVRNLQLFDPVLAGDHVAGVARLAIAEPIAVADAAAITVGVAAAAANTPTVTAAYAPIDTEALGETPVPVAAALAAEAVPIVLATEVLMQYEGAAEISTWRAMVCGCVDVCGCGCVDEWMCGRIRVVCVHGRVCVYADVAPTAGGATG